ncbi:hypothetical protein LQK93_00183 [Terrabacter sp. BE26]
MCHGDLVPPNVLIEDGRLVGVLDGGGFGPADPALDLVAAWHLLDETQRDMLRGELDCSDEPVGAAHPEPRREGLARTEPG